MQTLNIWAFVSDAWILLMLLSHLLLHVSSVLGSGWSHAHKLGLTQELDPRRLHPKSHATLSDRNNKKNNIRG